MEESMRVSLRSMRVMPDDVYLLCSDGVTDVLDDARLEELLGETRSPYEHARDLLYKAVQAGVQDNVAAVVIAFEQAEEAPKRRPSGRPPESASHIPLERAPLGSAPEIIIVGVETHVVPSESASASLLDALGRFARLRQPSVPEVGQPKPGRCRECGQPLEASATICPMCSAAIR
jgi:hypothetical protein